jgi:ribosomal 30S subunit maturation factor RimM
MLVGMTVVDSDGRSVGNVKDVAFVVGKMGRVRCIPHFVSYVFSMTAIFCVNSN